LPFAYLHIAYVGAINSKADSGAYLMETIGAGSPRVDVEEVIDGVVDDLQYVGVSCDKDIGLELLDASNSLGRVVAWIASDMGDKDPLTLALKAVELAQHTTCNASVDIAIDNFQRFESRYLVGKLQ